MLWNRVSAIALSLMILAGARAHAGELFAYASCADSSNISFTWTFGEDPQNPVGRPDWVGYDVFRRSLPDCDDFVRVNAEPFPRVPGTHSHTYTEVPPARGRTFEYRVALVDSERREVSLDPLGCYPCVHSGWASCPEFSAPLTHGTLEDWGWALFVNPCARGCYQSFYIEDDSFVKELRPYAGTGTAIRFYGDAYCGTVEGCGMRVDHYDVVRCAGPTPAIHSSWGRLKAVYR